MYTGGSTGGGSESGEMQLENCLIGGNSALPRRQCQFGAVRVRQINLRVEDLLESHATGRRVEVRELNARGLLK